ncbi:acyl carrier protein [Pedobacter sp. LMG 31464]|uniref:Acyl carrier protein n=1 Tax=Pedobacter planticolens TaxID=2679964 RepID=A0A923IWB9_9SPHI|nr:acyl carrier protein [Pedobacter planticolens]MBB2146971.1 acyl carrier protein [Pedobacter planticolens]
MERQEIFDGLLEIFRSVRQIDPEKLKNATEETDLVADLNVPSTERINIVIKAEQVFDVQFDDDDVDDLGSKMKDLINLIIETKKIV